MIQKCLNKMHFANSASSSSCAELYRCMHLSKRGKSLPLASCNLWSFQPLNYLFLLCNKKLETAEMPLCASCGRVQCLWTLELFRAVPQCWGPSVPPRGLICCGFGSPGFLERGPRETFSWDEEENNPATLQKAFIFLGCRYFIKYL